MLRLVVVAFVARSVCASRLLMVDDALEVAVTAAKVGVVLPVMVFPFPKSAPPGSDERLVPPFPIARVPVT